MAEDAIEVFAHAEEEGLQAGFDSLFGGGIAVAEKLVQQEATRGRAGSVGEEVARGWRGNGRDEH